MSIANEITRLQTAKADLKTAIMVKGVEVADTDTIDTYASKVEAIQAGGGETDFINPEWTNWSYFCRYRDSLASKLKYADTRNGTIFNNMFERCNVTEIPPIDTSNGTDFSYMFRSCYSLITIPELDTSNGTNFDSMLRGCKVLTAVPGLDTSKGTVFSNMFDTCWALTAVPKLDTSKGTGFGSMFQGCSVLTNISELDISNGTRVSNMFNGCRALVYIRFKGVILISINFQSSPLDVDSAKNIIECLVNYSGTDKEFSFTLTFSPTTWGYLDAEGETASPNGNSWREYINDLGWNAS